MKPRKGRGRRLQRSVELRRRCSPSRAQVARNSIRKTSRKYSGRTQKSRPSRRR